MKKTLTLIAKIAVSVLILIYLFRQVEIGKLLSELGSTDLKYFSAAVLFYFFIQAVSAYRWYLLLKPLGMETSYSKLLSFYFLGMYFNWFLPSAIGGDVFRIYYLNKETKRLSAATTSVFIDRDFGMAALLLIATATSLIAWTTFTVPDSSFINVPLAPLFILVSALFILANLFVFYRPTYNLLHKTLELIRMKKADEKVEHLYEAMNSYRGQWGMFFHVMIVSIIIQLGCVVVNVLTAKSIGITTANGWYDYLVFIPATGLISMVPASLNGIGWREASYLYLFQSVGVSEHEALSLAFLWLAVLLITSLPGGVIYILKGSSQKIHLGEVELETSGVGVGPNETENEKIIATTRSQ
jgi:hypothetical protein